MKQQHHDPSKGRLRCTGEPRFVYVSSLRHSLSLRARRLSAIDPRAPSVTLKEALREVRGLYLPRASALPGGPTSAVPRLAIIDVLVVRPRPLVKVEEVVYSTQHASMMSGESLGLKWSLRWGERNFCLSLIQHVEGRNLCL